MNTIKPQLIIFLHLLLSSHLSMGQIDKIDDPFDIQLGVQSDKDWANKYFADLKNESLNYLRKTSFRDIEILGANQESRPERALLTMNINFDKSGKCFVIYCEATAFSSNSRQKIYDSKPYGVHCYSGDGDRYEVFREGLEKALEKFNSEIRTTLFMDLSWGKARKNNSIDSYNTFLQNFPNSKYTDEAKQIIGQLTVLQLAPSANKIQVFCLNPAKTAFSDPIPTTAESGDSISMALGLWKDDSFIAYTNNINGGPIPFSDFDINCINCSFENGVVTILKNVSKIIGSQVEVKFVHLKSGTSERVSIPIGFRGGIVLDFSGMNGKNGMDGFDGSKGNSISKGSLLGLILSKDGIPGNFGGRGTAGTKGVNGADGVTPKDIDVYVLLSTEHGRDFLKGYVSNGDRVENFKIDVAKGGIKILANGGNGGNGGSGGRGGDGGDGEKGGNGSKGSNGSYPCGNGERGGNGGPGGDGGDGADGADGGDGGTGGDGAIVRLSLDPSAIHFQNLITIETNAGRGGRNGRGGYGGKPGREGQGGRGGNGGNKGIGTNCNNSVGPSGSNGNSGRPSNVFGRNGNDGSQGSAGRPGNISALRQSVKLEW